MGKRSLLLVDGDARSLRVLEVSLRKAGFVVTTAVNGRDGLEKARVALPDLIISDTDMPEMDGFQLCRAIKADPELARVPFVFLTGQTEIESKIRGLELGVDEYLTKPIYIKEILTRIRLLLQKKQRDTIETRRDTNTRFAGTLHDMGVVDLIQTIEVGRKSGLIHFSGPDGRQATIYFRSGAVIDAEAGHLQGADAVYRLLTWSDGEFELLFRTVRRNDSIDMGTPGLLMEGMRRLDEWGRLIEQLPPLSTRFEVDVVELAERLADMPDELNHILRLFDGRRSVLDVLDLAGVGDLECIELVSRLYFEELLVEVDGAANEAGESGGDLALEGWLGRKIPPTSELPVMEPVPGEVAAAAAAEWDSSEGEPSVEEVWPNLAGDGGETEPDEVAIDADEPPTPPSGLTLSQVQAAIQALADRPTNGAAKVPANGAAKGAVAAKAAVAAEGAALGRVDLVRRRSPSEEIAVVEVSPSDVLEEEEVTPSDSPSVSATSVLAVEERPSAADDLEADKPSSPANGSDVDRAASDISSALSSGGEARDASTVGDGGDGMTWGSVPRSRFDWGVGSASSGSPVSGSQASGPAAAILPGAQGSAAAPIGPARASRAATAGSDGVAELAPASGSGGVADGGREPAGLLDPEKARSRRVTGPRDLVSGAVTGPDPRNRGATWRGGWNGQAGEGLSPGEEPPRAPIKARPPTGSPSVGSEIGDEPRVEFRPRSVTGSHPVASGASGASGVAGASGASGVAGAAGMTGAVGVGARPRSPSGAQPVSAAGAAAARSGSGDDGLAGDMPDFDVSDQNFDNADTADKTPLPDPVPLGEERSNPGIKSSLGAEVATVSGEVAARRFSRHSDDQGREMVGVAPLQGEPGDGSRMSRSGYGVPGGGMLGEIGRGYQRPSVELDQELSAAAEVVEVIARRSPTLPPAIAKPAPTVGRSEPVVVAGADGEAHAVPAPRVSSMIRAASGPAFARAFIVTVAAATLVGGSFGLLFWWLSAREEGARASSVATSAALVESAPGGGRAPVASGSGVGAGGGAAAMPASDSPPGTSPGSVSPGSVSPGSVSPAAELDAESARPTVDSSSIPSPASAALVPTAGAVASLTPRAPDAAYEQLYDEARRARRRRDFTAALDLATRAGQLQPTAQAMTIQAEALLGLGEANRALPAADGAVQLKPRHAPAWYIKGKIHRALGQTEEARAAFNEYLRLDPEGARADQVIDLLQDM